MHVSHTIAPGRKPPGDAPRPDRNRARVDRRRAACERFAPMELDDALAWLLRDTRPGHARIAEQADGKSSGPVDYFRASGAVRITAGGK